MVSLVVCGGLLCVIVVGVVVIGNVFLVSIVCLKNEKSVFLYFYIGLFFLVFCCRVLILCLYGLLLIVI